MTCESALSPARGFSGLRQMKLDLYSFFQEQGYKNLVNLALAIGGQNGSASRLTLAATPTVSVGGVPIKYPGQIHIVDQEFRN